MPLAGRVLTPLHPVASPLGGYGIKMAPPSISATKHPLKSLLALL